MTDKSYRATPEGPVEAIACFDCPARLSDLCIGLSDTNLPTLFKASTHIDLDRGQTLFLDDEPAKHIYNIQKGTITVYRMGPAGQRQVLGFLLTGDLIGLTPGETYEVSAEACADAQLCRWERKKFEDFLALFPAMDRQFRLISSKVLASSIDLAFALGQLTAEQRVAGFLLHLAERQERNGAESKFVHLPMSRGDIADYLGLTIETVSRALTKLKTKHVIHLVGANEVQLTDLKVLQSLAAGEE